MVCKAPQCEDTTCNVYDLCKVTIRGGECAPGQETQIICEGFKFTAKLDVEVKTDSACYEGYAYQVSNMQYDWEITNPCDLDWFDRRFVSQICDKYSMQITGYVQQDCNAGWTPKETLTACIIEETGRDYGKGVNRTIRGKALHRMIHSGKWDNQGNVYHQNKNYERKTSAFERGGGIDQMIYGLTEGARKSFMAGTGSGIGGAYYGLGQAGDWINNGINMLGGGLSGFAGELGSGLAHFGDEVTAGFNGYSLQPGQSLTPTTLDGNNYI